MVQSYDLHTPPILQKETLFCPKMAVYDLHVLAKQRGFISYIAIFSV